MVHISNKSPRQFFTYSRKQKLQKVGNYNICLKARYKTLGETNQPSKSHSVHGISLWTWSSLYTYLFASVHCENTQNWLNSTVNALSLVCGYKNVRMHTPIHLVLSLTDFQSLLVLQLPHQRKHQLCRSNPATVTEFLVITQYNDSHRIHNNIKYVVKQTCTKSVFWHKYRYRTIGNMLKNTQ